MDNITSEQAERIASALDRIAAALEWINYKTPQIQQPVTVTPNPWTFPYPPTYPNISGGSISACGEPTTSGPCYLNQGHTGACLGATTWNVGG